MALERLTLEERQTIDFYDNHSAEWVKAHSSSDFWKEEFNRFNELMSGKKVIEIGSGGGRDAKLLITYGYEYYGIDRSEGLLKEAKKLNPDGKFSKQSVYDIAFPDNCFDGFWASAVLLHIPKNRIDVAMESVHRVVRKDGIGFISVKQGENERFEGERFFSDYQDLEFRGLLNRNGFEVLEGSVKTVSEKTTWLTYFVRVDK